MIGKPEWFQRRKYGGWGIHPKTKEGWIYIAIMVIPFIIFQSMPQWSNQSRIIVTTIWLTVLLVDVLDIMIHMKKDERETLHEALAERNALWVIIIILVAGLLYYSITNAIQEKIYFEPFISTALICGVITKGISNYKLEKNN